MATKKKVVVLNVVNNTIVNKKFDNEESINEFLKDYWQEEGQ